MHPLAAELGIPVNISYGQTEISDILSVSRESRAVSLTLPRNSLEPSLRPFDMLVSGMGILFPEISFPNI